jgi:CubicO group peptidase (beta-lactamase class C family)
VDESTVFAIGSAGKAFTTAALAILVDEGRLGWDDRVVDRLPGFALSDSYLTRQITIRDLVTHRTGLPGGRANLLFFGGGYDRAEIVRRLRFLEPNAGLRAEFQYQNIMFLAAGQVVAEAAGTTWDAFVRNRIFEPLGMTASSTSIKDLVGRANVATPHAKVGETVRTLPWRNVDNIGPAGSVNSTARDMTAWLRLHLGRGRYRDNRVFSDQAAENLRTPQIILPPNRMGSMEAIRKAGAASHFFTYALGWVVFDYRGRRVMWHGGNIDGMAAVVAMMPDEQLGLVVLTNLDSSILRDAVMLRVFDAYLGSIDRDWSRELLAVARADEARSRLARSHERPSAPGEPSRQLADYSGSYDDSLLGGLVITTVAGRLSFALETGLTGALVPLGGDRFSASWDDAGIAVVVSSLAGAEVRFSFSGRGPAIAAEFAGVGTFARRRR